MKKYLFAYAVLATALLFFTCRHYRAENRRLVENQTALAADVTRYRTRLGAEAASVQALRQEIVSTNPHTRIVYAEYVKIER